MYQKISAKIPQELYRELEQSTERNGRESMSHTIRELLELAIRVEKAAETNSGNEPAGVDLPAEIEAIKDSLKYLMTWTLEGRTYARVLLEETPGATKEKRLELVDTIKEKAKMNIREKEYKTGKP